MSAAWHWYLAEAISKDGTPVYPHASLVNPIAAGIGAALLIYAAIRQARIATRQAEIASDRHAAQTIADQQRHITESYSKAVEQLGSDKLVTRLGGIYTLERISRESPDDYWPVMETLCAFVREGAPLRELTEEDQDESGLKYQGIPPPTPPADIAAIMTVIVRRNENSQHGEGDEKWVIDFHRTCLRGVSLAGAKLAKANFRMADLFRANLCHATLVKTNFVRADLAGAQLVAADLSGANLSNGYEGDRPFNNGANLHRADLSQAILRGADLCRANLCGADLAAAIGLSKEQLSETTGDVETRLPEGMPRPAHWSPELRSDPASQD